MTEWDPPGPGPWQQDSAHAPVSQSAILLEIYPVGFNSGFTETFSCRIDGDQGEVVIVDRSE